jgi:hypothetical protein
VFNGSRFRAEIVPRIADFVLSNNSAGARSSGRRGASKMTATALAADAAPLPALATAANE